MESGITEPGGKGDEPVDEKRQIVLVGVAQRAVHLDGFPADAPGELAGTGLGPARQQGPPARFGIVVHLAQHLLHGGPRDLQMNEEIDGTVLQRLETADRPPELFARPEMGHRHLEGGSGRADHFHRRKGGRVIQCPGQRRRHPRAAGEHRIRRHRHRLEPQFGEKAAVGAPSMLDDQPFGIGRQTTEDHLLRLAGDDQKRVGQIGAQDPALAAAEDAFLEEGASRSKVVLAALLPGEDRHRLAGRQAGEELAGSGGAGGRQQPTGQDRTRDEGLGHHPPPHRLGDRAGRERTEPGTPHLFRQHQAEQTGLGHPLPDRAIRRRLSAAAPPGAASAPGPVEQADGGLAEQRPFLFGNPFAHPSAALPPGRPVSPYRPPGRPQLYAVPRLCPESPGPESPGLESPAASWQARRRRGPPGRRAMERGRRTARDSGHADIVWRPDPEAMRETALHRFMDAHGIADYEALLARADRDPEWFHAAVFDFFDLRLSRSWDRILDVSAGIEHARWCVGAETNITLSTLARHRDTDRRHRPALRFLGQEGERRELSYAELDAEVARVAGGLRRLGLGPGDRIALFLPMVPEAVVAMHAIFRIGAVAVPLFSGFGPEAVRTRLADAGAAAVFTAGAMMRRGRRVPLLETLEAATRGLDRLRHVILVDGGFRHDRGLPVTAMAELDGSEEERRIEILAADSPLLLVYTSGTTGRPKGSVQTHCGFMVKTCIDFGLCFDFRPGDGLFWMSDIGWVVGPILFTMPLLLGGTVLIADGTPDHPGPDRYWRLVEDLGTTHLGIAPTIVRSYMRLADGGGIDAVPFSRLRAVVSTGEPWTEAAWHWAFERICRRRIPILNYAGGTEMAGGILAGTTITPLKPLSFGGPIPGMGADIADATGRSLPPGEKGELVLRRPSISLTRGLWRDEQRYLETYWRQIPGCWRHGDLAARDEDGFWYLFGRSDDTIKLAGKRTGPSEIEAILTSTGEVTEAAAVGVPDPLKGEALLCFVVPRPGVEAGPALLARLADAVTRGMGAAFRPKHVFAVTDLPRTRNMKIMRRAVRAVWLGEPPGDLSSLVNPEALEEIRELGARGRETPEEEMR